MIVQTNMAAISVLKKYHKDTDAPLWTALDILRSPVKLWVSSKILALISLKCEKKHRLLNVSLGKVSQWMCLMSHKIGVIF